MSDDLTNQGVAVPGEAAPVPGGDYTPPSDAAPAAQDGGDVESRARANGWVPQDEFRGPPEKWRDAAEFVKRGEEELPVLRERNRALAAKLENLERGFKQEIQKLDKMSTLALDRQRQTLQRDYEAAMRDAVANGDVQRWDQLNRDMKQAVHAHDTQVFETVRGPVQQQPQQQNGPVDPIIESFVARNPWMTKDREMSAVAQAYSVHLEQTSPHLTMQQNLEATERYIKQQRYADRFGARPPANVESASRLPVNGGGGQRRRSAADLPADAKAQADKFVKQGLFKNRDEYAAEYFAQEGV